MVKKRNALRCVTEGAIMVALAQILGYLKIMKMPAGGSVSLIMLPIFIYAIRWGWKSGLLAGLALGILQFAFDGGLALGWQSIIGDYVLAYTMCGLAGLMKGRADGLYSGVLIGSLGRLLVLYVMGATVWAEWMPDVFLEIPMTSPWVYSLIYNGIYVGLSYMITVIVLALIAVPLKKYLTAADIQ